jgi:hypothetical protein
MCLRSTQLSAARHPPTQLDRRQWAIATIEAVVGVEQRTTTVATVKLPSCLPKRFCSGPRVHDEHRER